jgi:hypothetical protein
MAPKVAEALVAEHYRESTEGLMPAHLNRLWRAHKKQQSSHQREESLRRAITEAEAMAVPMPESIRQQIRSVMRATEMP